MTAKGQFLPLASKVQNLGTVIPEGHADTRNGVKDLKSVERLSCGPDIPETQLAVTHLGETGGGDPVVLTHPDSTAVLRAAMALALMHGLL